MVELLEGLGSSHAIGFLYLVDVPQREDHSEVHEDHALLTEMLDFNMVGIGVTLKNAFCSLDFVLGMCDDSVDHLIVSFTIVVAHKNLQNSGIGVHNFKQSTQKVNISTF